MDFSEVYEYVPDIPGGLRWKIDIWCGRNYAFCKIRKGDIAGGPSTDGGYWYTRYKDKGRLSHRVIWEMFYGVVPKGLEVDHIDGNPSNNAINNLRLVTKAVNTRNKKLCITNMSGVTGVNLRTDGKGTNYWTAQWNTLEGRRMSKHFSIKKFGNDEAFKLASEFRQSKIDELNTSGAGYTTRHGT